MSFWGWVTSQILTVDEPHFTQGKNKQGQILHQVQRSKNLTVWERWGIKFVTQTPRKSFHVYLGISEDVQSTGTMLKY